MIEITHKQARFLIRRAAERRLPEEQWTALQAHLENCSACRAYADRQRRLERDLRRSLVTRWRPVDWQEENLGRAVVRFRAARGERRRLSLYAALGLAAAAVLVLFSISRWMAGGPSSAALRATAEAAKVIPYLPPATAAAATEIASSAGATATAAARPAFSGVIAFEARPATPVEGLYLPKYEIFLLTSGPNGLEQTNLTNDLANDYSPAWSPDGEWLAFLSDRTGRPELYVISVAGTRLTQLTASENILWEGPLDWSADGRYIALKGSRLDQDGAPWIYLVPLDGSGPVSVPGTRGTPSTSGARFSRLGPLLAAPTADGSLMAYSLALSWSARVMEVEQYPTFTRLAGFDWMFGDRLAYQINRQGGIGEVQNSGLIVRGPIGPRYTVPDGSREDQLVQISGESYQSIAPRPGDGAVAVLPERGACRRVRLLMNFTFSQAEEVDLPGLCVLGRIDRSSWMPNQVRPAEENWLVAAARPENDPSAEPGLYLLKTPRGPNRPDEFSFQRLADLPGGLDQQFSAPQVRPTTGGSLRIQPVAVKPSIPQSGEASSEEAGAAIRAAIDGNTTALLTQPGADQTTSVLSTGPTGTENPRVLLRPDSYNRCPAWSPDRARVAFLSDRSYRQDAAAQRGGTLRGGPARGPEEVFVLDAASGEVDQLTSSAITGRAATMLTQGFTCPVWSPDGQYLAVVSTVGQGSALLVLTPGGQVVRRVPSDPSSQYSIPQWSPDGRTIYIAQPSIRGLAPRVVAIDWRDPVTGRTLLILDGWEDVHGLSLSPDGKSLAFVVVDGVTEGRASRAELRVVSLPGPNPQLQQDLPGYNASTAPIPSRIAWTEDGQVVAAVPQGMFQQDKARLVLFPLAKGQSQTLALLPDTLHDWSLSGRWLVYSTESGLYGLTIGGGIPYAPLRLSPNAPLEVVLSARELAERVNAPPLVLFCGSGFRGPGGPRNPENLSPLPFGKGLGDGPFPLFSATIFLVATGESETYPLMLAGTQLGVYQILEEIGRGGMATVYRARQPSMDRDVAIKIIQRGLTDPAAVQRFQREARLIARLEHPHILPVYDFDGAHDPPYIVMRYLDGGTLEGLMGRGILGPPDIAAIARQICSGLDYAHRQGVIHRDIKPSNILIDRDGNAFVSDFGIARSAAGPQSMRITQEGIVLGSVEYMSPEQVMGRRDLDYRADLYAMGAMLFQLLTGRLPFVSDPPLGVLMMHMQSPIPSACEVNPALPAAVDEVFHRAMAKKPEERFRSAVEMSALLDAALGISGGAQAGASGAGMALRETFAVPVPDRHPTPGSIVTPGGRRVPVVEHNRQIVALYANAAEYAEMVEASGDRETSYRSMMSLWSTFDHIVAEAGGVALTHTDSDMLAVWGANTAQEDDAEHAVGAALAMQTCLRDQLSLAGGDQALARQPARSPEEEQLPLNIGIHSGMALVSPITQPEARTGSYTITGATISLANRLMQSAYGTVLITHDVYRMVRGVFDIQPDLPLRVRGRAEGVPTYRVSSAKPRAFRPTTRGVEGLETRMVGREAELKRLQHAFLNAVEDAETQVVTITGEAGVGKSRLLDVFDGWCELRPQMYFLFRGRASGSGSRPYALLRDIIAYRFQIHDSDPAAEVVEKLENGVRSMIAGAVEPPGQGAPPPPDKVLAWAHRIGHLCGFDLSFSPQVRPLLGDPTLLADQGRKAFIDLVSYLVSADSVLFELEDLHLADDASLDLLNELFAASAGSHEDTHLIAACTARPALFSRRPDWGSQPFHTRVDLQPLDRRESRDLVREILKKVPEVPRALRDLLTERAEGNPYYMEELVKMLMDDRVIVIENENLWRVEESRLGALKVPPSLAALIEARLDTLLSPERLVLLRAAVFGRAFYSGALEAMDNADRETHGTAAHVADLPGVLASLVRRDFVHQREGSALEGSEEYTFAQTMLRDVVYDLLLDRQRRIYHQAAAEWLEGLERAGEHLLQIAEHYEQAGEWGAASAALGRAGDRACERGLFREAEALYERGMADLPGDDDAMRLALLLGLGGAANGRGDLPKAQPALEEALELAVDAGDEGAEASARHLLGVLEMTRGRFPAALEQLDLALPLARRQPDRHILCSVLYGLADTLFRSGDYHRAMEVALECRDLASELGDDAQRVMAMNRIATIHQMRFEREEAGAVLAETLELARRLGHRRVEISSLINTGVLNLVDGRADEAITAWEAAMVVAREAGDLFAGNIAAANLSVAYARAGKAEKVTALVAESIRMAKQMRSTSGLLRALLGIAELRLARGDIPGGLALFGLARSHPAAAADHVWGADRGLEYWQGRLAIPDPAPMLEAGKALKLETVLADFESGKLKIG